MPKPPAVPRVIRQFRLPLEVNDALDRYHARQVTEHYRLASRKGKARMKLAPSANTSFAELIRMALAASDE